MMRPTARFSGESVGFSTERAKLTIGRELLMSGWRNNHDPQAEALIAQIRKSARNLYQTRQLLCTEAVVVTLNKALNGGLSDAQAVAVSAPFSIALGESGCICGALSGAVLACSLLVGNEQLYHHRQRMRENARQLHDAFKATNGATCCRVLSGSGHGASP
ncbi:MAG: hypothetical protein DRG82_13765 [Deltaproteobacteria bacterium]|nr:MAG: hypothetical protein DRG82_13765 [Deltaproteobacteria bacterium]